MKGKIRIILDELRDIERTEGLGAITEGKINEICKAQGVSFDEFKSSVLKMLAEEAGISLDELNSFLLEEIGELEKISELDLDKISGGASVSDAVKRGAASLMAILNLSGMSNSYAGMPNSAKVRRDHGAVISKSRVPKEKVVLSKEEIAEKWAKRLGASAAGIALTLAVIGLNKLKNKENNASGDKAKTISVEELKRMNWMCLGGEQAREIAPKIFTSKRADNTELSLKSKFYVHMSEGTYKGAPMYVVGYIKPHDGSKPSILISDDIKCKNSGTVQIFENGLINNGDERVRDVIWGLKQSYIFNNSINLSRGKEVTNDIPKWVNVYKSDERTEKLSDDTDFTVLSGNAIATQLSEYKQYYVYLTDHYNPTSALRIVGVSEDNRSLLISDDFSCSFFDDEQQCKQFAVFSYDNLRDLVEDGIIARLRLAYKEIKSIDNVPAPKRSSAQPEVYDVSTISGVPNDACGDRDKLPEYTDELQQMFDWEKSDAEQKENDKTSEEIKALKKSKMALYVYGEDISHETAQSVTSERAEQSIALKLKSDYLKTQLGREQYKFASDIDRDSETIIKRVLGISEIPDLRLAIVGTASTDYHHLYKNPMIREKDKEMGEVEESGPSGRPSARYAKMFKNSSGEYCAIDTTTEGQELARSAMSINNTLRAMDGQWIKDGELLKGRRYLNPENIDYKKIKDIADKIGQMQAYHGCSSETFEKILNSGRLLCVDRVKDPLINKTDKQKVQAVWYSLSNSSKKIRPDASFEKLIKLYDTDSNVREFLKSCVGHVAKNLNRIAKWKKNITDQLNNSDTIAVKKYVEDSNTNSSLKDVKKAGLNGTLDIGMGTFQTIFSIVGGNCNAFEEYTHTDNALKFRCIIEIPQRCLSYTFPYAVVLDDAGFAHGLEDYATNGDAEDPKPSGVIIDKLLLERGYGDFPTGVPNINVTTGSLLFGDNPAYRKKDEYSAELGQAIKGKKLNIRKECARKALAFYIYCQYIVITKNKKDPGGEDVTADDILEAYYQKLGSHACMEGHSPGEIPLGESGAQRVLFVGIKTKDMDEVVEKARKQKMKVNCINYIPQTRAELIAAFEGCT